MHDQEAMEVIKTTREDVQRELDEYIAGIKYRLTSNVNKRTDPILDVFDMLQLQEVGLKTKAINHKKQFKNYRMTGDKGD